MPLTGNGHQILSSLVRNFYANRTEGHGYILRLDEAVASRAVFVILSGSDGRTDGWMGGNAFGAMAIEWAHPRSPRPPNP